MVISMTELEWHASINGQEFGPADTNTMNQWITDGRILAETMVWNSNMTDWIPASQVPEFSAMFMDGSQPGGGQYEARSAEQMEEERLPGELIRAVGNNGSVVVFKNKITIIRSSGLLTFALHGLKGDKEIYISKLTSIQLKKPGSITVGYIQFELGGGLSSQKGMFSAVEDENTVTFVHDQFDQFVKVKETIEELMYQKEMGHAQPAAPAAQSPAQQLKEWKDLLDAGAISDEEFQEKKKELLG